MNAATPKKREWPVIRVFVSSTFTDFKHERNALHQNVFRKLEMHCRARGFQFQAIDLRWGVPMEAVLDHRTMQICFEELHRSQQISPQPNFLILLGNRYGWRPLPEVISAEEFGRLLTTAIDKHNDFCGRSAADILRQWYVQDQNSRAAKTSPRCGDYLLMSRLTRFNGDARDYGKTRPNQDAPPEDTPEWKNVQTALWDIVNATHKPDDLIGRFAGQSGRAADDLPQIVRFQASATEQEIWRGAFCVEHAHEHVLAFLRTIDAVQQHPAPAQIRSFIDLKADGQIDADAGNALADLKTELRDRDRLGRGHLLSANVSLRQPTDENGVPLTDKNGQPIFDISKDHLESMCQQVEAQLKTIIDRQMDEFLGPQHAHEKPSACTRLLRGSQSVYLVQLPFRRLQSYFPNNQYFRAMQQWYRRVLGHESTIPEIGLWETPPWITWVQAGLRAAASNFDASINIQVVDLSQCEFEVDHILDRLSFAEPGSAFCVSPLTQNSVLTTTVAKELRRQGMAVLAGGAIASQLDSSAFAAVFTGRIESDSDGFLSWYCRLFGMQEPLPKHRFADLMEEHLDYGWVSEHYQGQTIYMRTFTHHGCPFACNFCADRKSGSFVVPPNLLQSELRSLSTTFRTRNALYVGDLTFGVSPEALSNLRQSLDVVHRSVGKRFRLIVQTNPTLISPRFVLELRKLGVVLVELGIESGSARSVRRAGKLRPSTEWLEQRIQTLLDGGIAVAGNLIVGLPDDDENDYAKTLEFILKWRDIVWFNVYGFVPYPGTPLFDRLSADGRITTDCFDHWCEGGEFVFEPYRMPSRSAYGWLLRILEAAAASHCPATFHSLEETT